MFRLDDERALVLTTDFFTPIVDDPADWGRIAAANALSDVYAMGGRPLFAVNLAAWPGEGLDLAILGQVLRGGAEVAAQAGCYVAGGHTIDDPVPKYGLAVTGLADPCRLMTIDRATPGDQLIVTKAIGTGVVATALKHQKAPADVIKAAVASMILLNAGASQAALSAGVRAATDVTGFGLLGHLHRMLTASKSAARLFAASVPLLPGAARHLRPGNYFISGGTRANTERMRGFAAVDPAVPPELAVLLHDAQTSGGLLLAVPPRAAPALLGELMQAARAPGRAGSARSSRRASGHVDVSSVRSVAPFYPGYGEPVSIRPAAIWSALLACLLTVLALAPPAQASSAPPRAQHVVVVGLSGLRWSDVSAARTPTLWRLA